MAIITHYSEDDTTAPISLDIDLGSWQEGRVRRISRRQRS